MYPDKQEIRRKYIFYFSILLNRFTAFNLLEDQNLRSVQYRGEVYYQVTQDIGFDTELLTFYGKEYSLSLGIDPEKFNDPKR